MTYDELLQGFNAIDDWCDRSRAEVEAYIAGMFKEIYAEIAAGNLIRASELITYIDERGTSDKSSSDIFEALKALNEATRAADLRSNHTDPT